MPNALTLLDVAKAHASGSELVLLETVMTHAPELGVIPCDVIQGTEFPTLDRHELPATGFTWANEGVAPGKSKFKVRNSQCFIFRGAVNCDKAVADAWNLQWKRAGGFQAQESVAVGRSAMIEIGKQVYYGIDEDAKGFSGLRAIWAQHFGISGIGVDATGSSANAATSVYAVKFGPEFCRLIFGGNKVLSLPPFKEQSVTDANGGQYEAYVSNLTSWVGLQCAHPAAVGRIYNLTKQAGKGLTDDLIADLLEKFPVGFTPDALFMTRQSRRQLQKSRTVVINSTGNGDAGGKSGNAAPLPEEAFGIPIIVTDSISNTEAVVV